MNPLRPQVIKVKFYVCFAVILLAHFPGQSLAQSYGQQQRQVFAYNILLNGCMGGIGGMINKNKVDTFLAAFGKNFLKGSLGGLVKYSAKRNLYTLPKNNRMLASFANRAYYYFGHSLVRNATLNKAMLDTYNIQLYGIDLNITLKDKVKIQPRLSLLTCYYFWLAIKEDHTFNLGKSLQYSVFYFDQNTKYSYVTDGRGAHNVIAVSAVSLHYNQTITHELVHTYQHSDYFLITHFAKPLYTKLNTFKPYLNISKFVYMDVDYLTVASNILQPNFPTNSPHYHKNFYEFEAQHFATRAYIHR